VAYSRLLQPGDIVLAEVNDPQGRNPKKRPLVVVATPDQLDSGSPFPTIFVSTREPDSSFPFAIRLPFSQRRALTGLKKQSWAYCNHIVMLDHNSVLKVLGIVKPEKLAEIVAAVSQAAGETP
jgi:mRNA-degrading endonuclease toxin of MazEF toxin-antitoxin module